VPAKRRWLPLQLPLALLRLPLQAQPRAAACAPIAAAAREPLA
jgi:hypothetical protein